MDDGKLAADLVRLFGADSRVQDSRLLRMDFPHDDGPPDTALLVNSLRPHEEMSRDFRFDVDLLSDNLHVPLTAMYLATVLDLYARKVVGWAMAPNMPSELVCTALQMAIAQRHPPIGLVVHSDRGSQYASKDFRDVLAAYGITASMSRRGNCWDNACSETLFGSLKGERLHGQRFKTRRQAMDEVVAWMFWYNRTRLHSTLAYVSPMRFEENWHANQPRQVSA